MSGKVLERITMQFLGNSWLESDGISGKISRGTPGRIRISIGIPGGIFGVILGDSLVEFAEEPMVEFLKESLMELLEESLV